MNNSLKYIVDDNGHKSSVLVPIKVREELNTNYKKLQNKLEILNSIGEGLNEVQDAKKTGRKLQTLKEYIKY